jgi:hypothetical protein
MSIVTGSVVVVADDVAQTVARVREHVQGIGGTVVSERIAGGAGNRPNGSMSLRVPPKALDSFVAWLSQQGRVEERQLQREDVSRTYFEQELALKNLELTARRLQDLMNGQAGNLNDVLAVERELTRVRGEIEQLKGSQRYLQDRVAQATIELQVRSKQDSVMVAHDPEMKFMLMPSLDVMSFVDEGQQERTRWGGGVSLLFDRAFSLDVSCSPHAALTRVLCWPRYRARLIPIFWAAVGGGTSILILASCWGAAGSTIARRSRWVRKWALSWCGCDASSSTRRCVCRGSQAMAPTRWSSRARWEQVCPFNVSERSTWRMPHHY